MIRGGEQTTIATAASTPTVVCTLGMHRSGTSLTSRLLNLLGVYLGPDEAVSGVGRDNPKGYWEHHPLSLLNDEVLAHFGGRWDTLPTFPPDWNRDPRLDEVRGKARRIVEDDFLGRPLWGWKDPRTCLTLPFWRDVVGPMRYVICIRNPRSVLASLARRDDMPAEDAETLWLAHVHASLAATDGHARLFMFYEDMIANLVPELQRLAAFVGQTERGNDPVVQAAAVAFLETELCHHRTSADELLHDRHLAFETKALYMALRGQVSDDALTQLGAVALHTAHDRKQRATAPDVLVHSSQAHHITPGDLASERNQLVAAHDHLVHSRNRLRDAYDRLRQGEQAHQAALAAAHAERDRLVVEINELTAVLGHMARRDDDIASED